MDFMVSLPPSRGFDAIMVVVDRFNKMAHFIFTKESATAQEMERLFFTHVFKHHGLRLPRTLFQIETQSSQVTFGEPCESAWGQSSR
jgi:hypothetical protein